MISYMRVRRNNDFYDYAYDGTWNPKEYYYTNIHLYTDDNSYSSSDSYGVSNAHNYAAPSLV